ncbi:hypothetical protein J6590_087251 [Homalodisca vitripennis]|nr:hypothetical protein J6590_087251 [Homalodisca vitripennis]
MFWKIMSEISGASQAIAASLVPNFASVADSGCGKTVAVSNSLNDFFSQVGLSLASKLPRPFGPLLVDDAVYRIDHVFQLEPLTDSQVEKCVAEMRGGSAPGCTGRRYSVEPLTVTLPGPQWWGGGCWSEGP